MLCFLKKGKASNAIRLLIEPISYALPEEEGIAFFMKRLKKNTGVFRFYSLQADRPVFAWEAQRHPLLKALVENGLHQEYTICAFSIQDDAVYLLLHRTAYSYLQEPIPVEQLMREGRSLLPDGYHLEEPILLRDGGSSRWGQESTAGMAGEKTLTFREGESAYQPGIRREEGRQIRIVEKDSGWSIYDPQEVIRLCQNIHLQPLREGYVEDINDYWFSSWQSYRDYYIWTGVDIDPVLKLLSAKREKALQRFQAQQKQQMYQIIKKC